MTEKHANIAAALAAAQAQMGKALKQSNNPHFRSKYADLGNVMDACMPALNANGIAVVQHVGRDEHGMFLKTILRHADSETWFEDGGMPLLVNKNDMQGLGSALTYARRYGLMAMVGIAPEDDDGNAAAAAPPRQQAKPAPAPDFSQAIKYLAEAETLDDLTSRFKNLPDAAKKAQPVIEAAAKRKAEIFTDAAQDLAVKEQGA